MMRYIGCLIVAGWLCSISPARAEKLPIGALNPEDDRAAQIAQLIEDLDQPEFADRQEASQKLAELGKEAVPQLEKAVARGNREVSGRALDILKRHWEGQDADGKQAAKESLERLAGSDHATTAQRARNVLYPRKEPASGVAGGGFRGVVPAVLPAGGNIGGGGFGGGGFGGGGVVVRKVSMHIDANGARSIKVQENDRTTTLETQPNGRIVVTLTELKNGRNETRTIEAADLNDLRKKDPQAAQLYEQNDRPPVIRVGALPNFRIAPGGGGIPIPVIPAPPPPNAGLQRTLDSLDASIENYKARLPNDPTAQRAIESLERAKQHFKDRLTPDAPVGGK